MTTTTSTLLLNRQLEAHAQLRSRCEAVANKGGSYSITTCWQGSDWVTKYVINWPSGVKEPA